LNNALTAFPEVGLFTSHDHELVSTVANRTAEVTPDGTIDLTQDFDEYLAMRKRPRPLETIPLTCRPPCKTLIAGILTPKGCQRVDAPVQRCTQKTQWQDLLSITTTY